jgi:hypothetical protein
MFFELYYKADNIEYTNIPDEGEYLIYMYQANDLQYYPENSNKDIFIFLKFAYIIDLQVTMVNYLQIL